MAQVPLKIALLSSQRGFFMLDYIETDYGIVILSPETVDYLNGLAENWRTYPQKPRSKRGKWIKAEIDKVVTTVCHVSKIGFATGREVEYF